MELSWKFPLSLSLIADYVGREEVENGKMDESCGRVGSTLFFFPVRIERKKEEMINFHTRLLLHPRRSIKTF